MTTAAGAGQAGPPAARQSRAFLGLYSLAFAGGAVAYMPLLTVLLPVQVERMTGGGAAQIAWLGQCFVWGAIAASLSNIAFGWLSDRLGNRRLFIWAGLIASSALLLAIGQAATLPQLLVLIVAWQVALNMMLGPLTALAGDSVPDAQKGMLGGLLSLAPGLGAVGGALVTWSILPDPQMRLAIVALMVCACVLPLLLAGRGRPFPQLMKDGAAGDSGEVTVAAPSHRSLAVRMWLARFLVQVADAALFAFLYTWFRQLSADFGDDDTARLFGVVLVLAIPLTLIVGRWSDRAGRPILPLAVSSAIAGLALLAMAASGAVLPGIAAYAVFGLATSLFLSLHAAQTLRVLPRPSRRGRDLGLFNLTNTLPALTMALLSLDLIPRLGFSGFFALLAGLVLAAAALLASARPIGHSS